MGRLLPGTRNAPNSSLPVTPSCRCISFVQSSLSLPPSPRHLFSCRLLLIDPSAASALVSLSPHGGGRRSPCPTLRWFLSVSPLPPSPSLCDLNRRAVSLPPYVLFLPLTLPFLPFSSFPISGGKKWTARGRRSPLVQSNLCVPPLVSSPPCSPALAALPLCSALFTFPLLPCPHLSSSYFFSFPPLPLCHLPLTLQGAITTD